MSGSNGMSELRPIRCSAAAHVGHVRSNNEDTVEVSSREYDGKLTQWVGEVPALGGWAIVADGMGGHAAGEVASELAVELLRPVMGQLRSASDIALAVNVANHGLYKTMSHDRVLRGMGTTVAGVILHGDRAVIFNVGDSRIYLYLDGKLTKLSQDDVVGGHMLTQCLGGVDEPVALDPHVKEITLQRGAKLLMCSDGLTDMVPDDAIAEVLSGTSGDHAQTLVEAALDAGGIDNVSVVVIEIA